MSKQIYRFVYSHMTLINNKNQRTLLSQLHAFTKLHLFLTFFSFLCLRTHPLTIPPHPLRKYFHTFNSELPKRIFIIIYMYDNAAKIIKLQELLEFGSPIFSINAPKLFDFHIRNSRYKENAPAASCDRRAGFYWSGARL